MSTGDEAEAFVDRFSEVYLHLHPRREAREYRPSRESLALLHHLAQSGPLSVLTAAKHFGRSQAAMSEMLDRLIRRGLLARLPDEKDRRRHLVWLTEEGQRCVIEETRPLDLAQVRHVLGRLSSDQREQILESLRVLSDEVRAYAQERRKQEP